MFDGCLLSRFYKVNTGYIQSVCRMYSNNCVLCRLVSVILPACCLLLYCLLVIIMEPAGQNSTHGVAMETQAIGRSVRLGQTRHVTVTRFVIEGTIEEKIHELNVEARKKKGNSILQPSEINDVDVDVEVLLHVHLYILHVHFLWFRVCQGVLPVIVRTLTMIASTRSPASVS